MAEQLRRTFPKKPSNSIRKPPEMMKHQEKIKSVSPADGCSVAIPVVASEEISQKIIDPSAFPLGNSTNRFFAVLLSMERKYGWNQFKWAEIKEEYEKLFNEKLSSFKLGIICGAQNGKINISVTHFLNNMCSIFAIITTGPNPTIRLRRYMNVGNNNEIALAYAAFERSQEEGQAPPLQPAPTLVNQETIDPTAVEKREDRQAPPSFHNQTPLLQAVFTTFLALERQFGEAEFTWEDMVEVHQRLCGETLNVDLLERVVGGMERGEATLRNILGGQLAQVLELTDFKSRVRECESNKNPRVRFRQFKEHSIPASRDVEWSPGKPMSKFFVEAQYAAFKTSQGCPTKGNTELDLQSLFATLLTLERSFEQTDFAWDEMVYVHQKLFNETLTFTMVARVFGRVGPRRTPTINGVIYNSLERVLKFADHGSSKNPRFCFQSSDQIAVASRDARARAAFAGQELSRFYVAAEYLAFKAAIETVETHTSADGKELTDFEPAARNTADVKASQIVVPGQRIETQAPPPPTAPTVIEPEIIPQAFFSALLTMERKYGQNVFEWEELEQEYRKLSTKATSVFHGDPKGGKLLIIIMSTLCKVLQVCKPTAGAPLTMSFRPVNMWIWTYADPSTMKMCQRVAVDYAKFKQSQGFVAEQNEEEQAPSLLQVTPNAPASAVIKQANIDPDETPTVDTKSSRKKKRATEGGKESIDEDEPKIKKERTENDGDPKAKEESLYEIEKEIRVEETDIDYEIRCWLDS